MYLKINRVLPLILIFLQSMVEFIICECHRAVGRGGLAGDFQGDPKICCQGSVEGYNFL
jgi:hypothetical protein